MPELYRNKIVQAFRDHAIKSVLLIDDEYLPYENLVESHNELMRSLNTLKDSFEGEALSHSSLERVISDFNKRFKRSTIAAEFVEFFHNKQLICDVEDRTDNLEQDKVRKSDLIILDYHLNDTEISDNPAERSLKLINELSKSKHMNIVVIYTKEDLKDVWREVAATLRGTCLLEPSIFFDDETLYNQWQENNDDWTEAWDLITSGPIQESFLKAEHDIERLTRELTAICDEEDYATPDPVHVEWLLEQDVRGYNKNDCSISDLELHGTQKIWLQAGDVFVVLCSKERDDAISGSRRDTTAEEVWESIETALVDWYPSFYRVVTSELQNQIEDANLSMEKVLSKGHVEQIAYLWGVLRVEDEKRNFAVQELLQNLLEEVVNKVQSDQELLKFVKETAENIDAPMPVYNSSRQYTHAAILSGHKNQKYLTNEVDKAYRCEIGHAYNEQLSIEKEFPAYISTGVVVKDIDRDGDYYVCIAPSCNTVPNQETGLVIGRMKPHRPMRFIKLKKKNLSDCLAKAHQSNYIFICDGSERLSLSVFEKGEIPTIVQGVIVNHDTELITKGGSKDVQFIETNRDTLALALVTKQLKPLGKLKPGFASRYQNTQFLYESRIGVDLVSADM